MRHVNTFKEVSLYPSDGTAANSVTMETTWHTVLYIVNQKPLLLAVQKYCKKKKTG